MARASYMDEPFLSATGVDPLPTEDFVLPVVAGKNVGMWVWRYHGAHRQADGTVIYLPQTTGWAKTEEQGWAEIDRCKESTRRFWREKIAWRLAGDRVESGRVPQLSSAMEAAVYHGGEKPQPKVIPTGQRNVLRHNHGHYTVRTFGVDKTHRDGRGFGGRVFRWRFLDDPENTVHESNDVFWQGHIPEELWDELPDNVAFIDNQYAVPTLMI